MGNSKLKTSWSQVYKGIRIPPETDICRYATFPNKIKFPSEKVRIARVSLKNKGFTITRYQLILKLLHYVKVVLEQGIINRPRNYRPQRQPDT